MSRTQNKESCRIKYLLNPEYLLIGGFLVVRGKQERKRVKIYFKVIYVKVISYCGYVFLRVYYSFVYLPRVFHLCEYVGWVSSICLTVNLLLRRPVNTFRFL